MGDTSGITKILDGVTELGNTTIENASIAVDLDAANDSVKIGAQASGASGQFYQEASTAVSPAWSVIIAFGFLSQGILLENKGAEEVEVSFDGTNIHTKLGASGSVSSAKAFDHRHETGVYIRSASGGVTVAVEAW